LSISTTTERYVDLTQAERVVQTAEIKKKSITIISGKQIQKYRAFCCQFLPFKDEAQTALFKDPVRTAQ
jgi:hypothetical protein